MSQRPQGPLPSRSAPLPVEGSSAISSRQEAPSKAWSASPPGSPWRDAVPWRLQGWPRVATPTGG